MIFEFIIISIAHFHIVSNMILPIMLDSYEFGGILIFDFQA